MMICDGCGQPMPERLYRCTSNKPGDDGQPASCRNARCPGLKFCSSECLQKCWRSINWPKVVYIVEPALDEAAASDAADKLVENVKLDRMWGEDR